MLPYIQLIQMKYLHSGNKICKVAIPKLVLVPGYLSLSVCCSVTKSQITVLEQSEFLNIIYVSISI